MRKFLLVYSTSATLLLAGGIAWLRHATAENNRLQRNQEALTSEIEHYTTRYGEAVATIQGLELRISEFREIHERDAERIRNLDIALRRVENTSIVGTSTELSLSIPLRDTAIRRENIGSTLIERVIHRPLLDSISHFHWSDSWVKIEGIIRNHKVECHIESIDTLRQIVHRVPHKFLFLRFGTRAIRQEIVSSNPHTKVVYAEYIELRGRQHRRR